MICAFYARAPVTRTRRLWDTNNQKLAGEEDEAICRTNVNPRSRTDSRSACQELAHMHVRDARAPIPHSGACVVKILKNAFSFGFSWTELERPGVIEHIKSCINSIQRGSFYRYLYCGYELQL